MRNRLADVVTTALRLLDDWGLDSFSMRRLAAELGVAPSALYHHVASKQELLGHLAARIVGGVVVDDDVTGTCRRLREAMLQVRDGAEVVATATAFRLGISAFEAELARRTSPDVARTLLIYVVGHTQATQLHWQASGLGAIPADPDLDASFDSGLAIILAGWSRLAG
ncbi:MAG: helix-turn-helix domain-containing protein [Propionicimonas sp.]|uniref:TetR/AcrR family transcriptional regulator n=1 Tax=Propionicimonas sp. TaxID=1955623 RepID=UPI002B20AA37|nr:helix-turn-helix domain-containing protein [Propionicimonas sp.]MEA4945352.1 helix-turn-helix domain-containing protein [Propionicimonas sp.]MEA5053806.1 helix-turn-helix domain-containing protein [Propionicimonas sp.]MEA5116441.1 helix-turn-helix domain-containing protein [Propionicimonas sp.]